MLKNPFMFLATFIFVVSHLKIQSFRQFENSDVIVVKKRFMKYLLAFVMFLSLDVQIKQTRILMQ